MDSDTQIDLGEEITVEILWPVPEMPAGLEVNDTSIVMRLTYASHSVLFTGDIEYAGQRWLLENEDISADVLLLPHHGGVRGNTAAFVETTGARYLVRSSFAHNADSIELMHIAAGKVLFNTAEVGAIEIVLGADNLTLGGFAGK